MFARISLTPVASGGVALRNLHRNFNILKWSQLVTGKEYKNQKEFESSRALKIEHETFSIFPTCTNCTEKKCRSELKRWWPHFSAKHIRTCTGSTHISMYQTTVIPDLFSGTRIHHRQQWQLCQFESAYLVLPYSWCDFWISHTLCPAFLRSIFGHRRNQLSHFHV